MAVLPARRSGQSLTVLDPSRVQKDRVDIQVQDRELIISGYPPWRHPWLPSG